MAGLPQGTVTFLLTDVENSTRLWSTDPVAAASSIRRTYEVIQECVRAHGGHQPVEQGEGDSTVSVFVSASDALAAAVDAQLALTREPEDGGSGAAVRMALHTGEAELRDAGNYMGTTIIRCARLRDLGNGGDVLLSTATAGLVADHLPAMANLVDVGEYQLRGLTRPERVWRLAHPELAAPRPLRSDSVERRTNLRRLATPLIGRDREVAEIESLLADAPLVTLTGSGGVGKTRMAHQVATRAVEDYNAGAWWADLALVTDAAMVPSAVVAAIGIPEEPGRPALESLLAWLEHRTALVVLDNCEHLVDAAAALAAAITESCPNARLVATSREPLGVVGEVTWRTPSLSVPPVEAATVDAIESFDAVQLFLGRAHAARPDYELTDTDAPFVSEVCRRLDGLPLAVELAAARVRSMSLQQLASSLDDRFRTLTGGARTAVPRQRTLNACVAWSYDHLDAREQRLFRRLGVFAGSFTAASVEAVCSDDDLPSEAVLPTLASLADRSMVEVHRDGRYRLLETLRHFAQEQALQQGEIDTWRNRHLAWCGSIAPGLFIDPRAAPGTLNRVLDLLPDLRQGLSWSLASTGAAPIEVLQTVACALGMDARYESVRVLALELHGVLDPESPGWVAAMAALGLEPTFAADVQAMGWQAEALALATEPLVRSQLLRATAFPLLTAGEGEGERRAREAAELARVGGSARDELLALDLLAAHYAIVGRLREARPLIEQLREMAGGTIAAEYNSTEGFAAGADSLPEATRLFRLGVEAAPFPGMLVGLLLCALWAGEADLADETFGTDRWSEVSGVFRPFAALASALPAILSRDFARAATTLRPSLGLATLGNSSYWLRLVDADLAFHLGDRPYVEAALDELRATWSGKNLPTNHVHALVLWVGLALLDDDIRRAQEVAHRALDVGVDNEAAMLVVDGLEAVAITEHRLGRGDLAGRLVGAAEAQRDRSGYRWRHAPLDLEIPSLLDDGDFRAARDAGCRLTLSEAVAEANGAR